jgi:hypothetical protein
MANGLDRLSVDRREVDARAAFGGSFCNTPMTGRTNGSIGYVFEGKAVKIAIVGAGIGGLSAALALAQTASR